ncbi:MAG: CehA/McbA family metallohydrolase [Verrucomicrobiota bacterium]
MHRPLPWLLAVFLCAQNVVAATAEVPLAARYAVGAIQPRVSPDGQWIAVSYQGAIGKVPVTGGTLTLLTSGEGWDVEPAWSPDGKRIAYIQAPGFNAGQLQLIQADGAPLKLPQAVRGQGPLWFHPDGARVLGRLSTAGAPNRIAWCDLATARVAIVEGIPDNWSLRLRVSYALSPDGKWIYYAEHLDREGEQGGNNSPAADVWRIPSSGGTPEKLFQFPARLYTLAADAQGLYASTDLGTPHNDLWHVPLKNSLGGARKLTFGQADDDAPSVSGDERHLVYTDNQAGATALIHHDLQSGERRTVGIERIDYPKSIATLRLRITDQTDGKPAVARVAIKAQGGKFIAPPGALFRITVGLGHFYTRGEETLSVPAGKYEVLVFRGPEYRMARAEVELAPGQSRELSVALERWTNANRDGWYSGENHIHANYGYGAWYNTPRTILDQCEGEDLNVCNLVVANSDGDAVFDREFFRGRPDPLSTPRTILYWNQEFRSTLWGHMTLFDLDQLVEPIFTGFKGTTNPWDVPTNADIAQRARDQRGTASYTHPTGNAEDFYNQPYSAKGLPVDAALGRIDTMDVMGWVYDSSVPFWYRLLNCGFRLPAAAGTDCFLNRIPVSPPGWGRVYVHLPDGPDGLTYDGWIAGLKAGRSFITLGPMLEFTVNGKPMGDTISLASPGVVRVKGKARSQFPLEKLEIISNGKVIATGKVSADKLEASFDEDVRVETSGWIAMRVTGPVARYWLGRGMNAHSNPVYLELKGRPQDARADAEYFLGWIDRLETDVKRRDRLPPGGASHVQMQLNAARDVYRRLKEAGR